VGASHGSIAGGREAFIEEARLLSRLDHPALVQVLAAFETHHTAYRVMPFHDGVTLAQARQQRMQMPNAAQLASLLQDLLAPVEALHRTGVVHGFLHPEQVMLLPDDRVLVLGFGTARRALHAPLDHAYAPLEQSAMGGHLPRGAWTDLYSIAALAMFFATGRAPVASTERNAGLRFNAAAELAKALHVPAEGDPDGAALVAAIDRALALVPSARWQTAAEFRHALEHFAPPEEAAPKPAVHAEPRTPPVELDPSVRKAIARAVESIPESTPLWPESRRHEPSALNDADLWQATRPREEPELAAHAAPRQDDSDAAGWHATRTYATDSLPRRAPRRESRRAWLWMLSALLVAFAGVAAWRWSETNSVDEQIAKVTELLPRLLPASERLGASVPPPKAAPAEAQAPAASAAQTVAAAAPASAVVAAPVPVPAPPPQPAASAAPAATGDLMAERALPAPAAGVAPAQPAAAVVTAAPAVQSAPAKPVDAQPQPPAPPVAQAPPAKPQPRSQTARSSGTRTDGALQPRRTGASAADPREMCGNRRDFALLYCLRAQCKKPQYEASEQCRALRRGGELR